MLICISFDYIVYTLLLYACITAAIYFIFVICNILCTCEA